MAHHPRCESLRELAVDALVELYDVLVDLFEAPELALEGKVEEHHRFILEMQLRDDDGGEDAVDAGDLGEARVVLAIRSELGTDMTVFKSPAHLAAWAGVCPGNNQSAGKHRKGTARKGNVHLMTALVEAARCG